MYMSLTALNCTVGKQQRLILVSPTKSLIWSVNLTLQGHALHSNVGFHSHNGSLKMRMIKYWKIYVSKMALIEPFQWLTFTVEKGRHDSDKASPN